MGQRAKFVFVAAGIFICYFYYGILQVSPCCSITNIKINNCVYDAQLAECILQNSDVQFAEKNSVFLNRFRLCDFVFREGYLILKAVSLGRKISIQLRLLRSELEFFSPVFGRYRMCR